MTLAAPAPVAFRRIRSPDAWLWAAAAAGWLGLAVLAVGETPEAAGGHHHGAGGAVPGGTGSAVLHVVAGMAMVAAMLPLIAANVRFAALRSPRRARPGVAVAVVAGWALVWAGATAALVVAVAALDGLLAGTATLTLATVVAVGWQGTREKRRRVARCSRRLAPPLDRSRGRRAAWRYGVTLGSDCVVSCWALMALATAARHSLPVAGVCVGVAWYERRRRPHHDPGTLGTSVLVGVSGAAALAATSF